MEKSIKNYFLRILVLYCNIYRIRNYTLRILSGDHSSADFILVEYIFHYLNIRIPISDANIKYYIIYSP